VGLHQRRAPVDALPSVVGAAVAMVWAASTNRLARLHVSGDFGGPDAPDMVYVEAIERTASFVRALRGGQEPVAWTYTHHADGSWVRALVEAGVAVRLSERLTGPAGGAVVVRDRAHARSMRKSTGARIAVCPAQLSNATCASCRLCWERPDLTIAFIAHGFQGRRLRQALENRMTLDK